MKAETRPNIDMKFMLIVNPKTKLIIFRSTGKGPADSLKLCAIRVGRYGRSTSPKKLPIMAHIRSNKIKVPVPLCAFPTIDFSPLDNNYSTPG
jgi:hypothetical protein